jgi:hypothetical protein
MKTTILRFACSMSLFLFFHLAQGQLPRATGLVFDQDAYDKTEVIPEYPNDGARSDNLQVKVDLRPYCPPVRDQGMRHSCGAEALAASLDIQYRILSGKELSFSSPFIYNQVKMGTGCEVGSRFLDGLELCKAKGAAFEELFQPASCDQLPASEVKAAALPYRITTYRSLFRSYENASIKTFRIKSMLDMNIPVIAGMRLTTSIAQVSPSNPVWRPSAFDKLAKNHAVVVVGYDSYRNEFTLLNSWGSGWGDGGYFRMKFSDFAAQCREAFVMIIHPRALPEKPGQEEELADLPSEVELNGGFRLQRPAFSEARDSIFFQSVAVNKTGPYYELIGKSLKIDDAFQLVMENGQQPEFLYAFSVDPNYTLNFHFPLPAISHAQADEEQEEGVYSMSNLSLQAFREKSLVVPKQAEVVIPGPGQVMALSDWGDDYLFVLYSNQALDSLPAQARQIRDLMADSTSAAEALSQVMGESLVPLSDITFHSRKMSFEAEASKGTVVPLILKLTAKP